MHFSQQVLCAAKKLFGKVRIGSNTLLSRWGQGLRTRHSGAYISPTRSWLLRNHQRSLICRQLLCMLSKAFSDASITSPGPVAHVSACICNETGIVFCDASIGLLEATNRQISCMACSYAIMTLACCYAAPELAAAPDCIKNI